MAAEMRNHPPRALSEIGFVLRLGFHEAKFASAFATPCGQCHFCKIFIGLPIPGDAGSVIDEVRNGFLGLQIGQRFETLAARAQATW